MTAILAPLFWIGAVVCLTISLPAFAATAKATPDARKPGAPPHPATPTKAAPPEPAAKAEAPIPKSVFTLSANIYERRNPFFPVSLAVKPDPGQRKAPDSSAIVLNGITGPPKRTAMVNGTTFETGEAGSIKVNGVRLPVICIEVRDNAAVILVSGERRELRLRKGL